MSELSVPAVDVTGGEVRCPQCERGFLAANPAGGREMRCDTCSSSYPVTDGVVDLLPGTSMRRSLAQMSMEAEPIVRIYESRLWRRGPHVAFALGISFQHEQELIVRAAELKGAETILDLACGPGIYARPFAREVRAGHVVGLDLSLPMLRYASRRAREEGPTSAPTLPVVGKPNAPPSSMRAPRTAPRASLSPSTSARTCSVRSAKCIGSSSPEGASPWPRSADPMGESPRFAPACAAGSTGSTRFLPVSWNPGCARRVSARCNVTTPGPHG